MMTEHPWSEHTVAERLEHIIRRVQADTDDVKGVYTQLFHSDAESERSRERPEGSALSGALVSVKDLFDVAGFRTRAGTLFMRDDPKAIADAHPIANLRAAGATLVGHTNMTELAYSGLGLNPHYGTAQNSILPACIPGGSTSGGAISVARNLADIAIGTDTGGSLRIPAAFNNLVGFKPSQASVSRAGCKPLSTTLDSVGPIARTVSACKLAFDCMKTQATTLAPQQEAGLCVPTHYATEDMHPVIAEGFTAAVSLLSAAGLSIWSGRVPLLDQLASLPAWQFAAVESRAQYNDIFQNQPDQLDPRIASRMARADEVSAVEYRQTLNHRQMLASEFQQAFSERILLTPTVPVAVPTFAELDCDEAYFRINVLALRNPSIANVLAGCSVSLPFQHQGQPMGIMLTAPSGYDDYLLSMAARCEAVLAAASQA